MDEDVLLLWKQNTQFVELFMTQGDPTSPSTRQRSSPRKSTPTRDEKQTNAKLDLESCQNCNLVHAAGPVVPVQQGDNGVGAAALRIFVDHRAAQDPGAADFMVQQAQSDAAPAAQGSEDSEMNQVDEENEQEGKEDQEVNEDQEGQDDHL